MKRFTLVLFWLCSLQFTYSQSPFAVDLDGDNDYLFIGDVNDLGTSDFTIEAWFYIDSYTGVGNTIVMKGITTVGTPSQAGYMIRVGYTNPNELDFIVHGSSGVFYQIYYPNVQTGQWYHVAGVKTDSTMQLYINCELVGTTSIPLGMNVDTDMPLAIGATDKGGLSTTNSFFDGKIDEVRIWTVVRQNKDICYWKDCTIDALQPDLLAVYNMDHSSGLVATDYSGNDNHGIIQGGGGWAPTASAVGGDCFLEIPEAEEIESMPAGLKILVYPNPVLDKLNFTGLPGNSSFEIFDMSGKLIFDGELILDEPLDVNLLESGTYIVNVKTEYGSATIRFIKQ